jgi:predicted ATPase
VRIGIHTGEAQERNSDYYGQVVNRVARIESAAHGGQTILSAVTYELVRDQLSDDTTVIELGSHRLKDLTRAETVYQVSGDGHETDFPPLSTLDTHRHNLPIQSTPFIGREEEVSHLADLVTGGRCRMVTILGPGGMGKTRTALQVAAETIEHFDDGTYFVDLSGAGDAQELLDLIADALPMMTDGNRATVEGIAAWLHDRSMLIILDNFEQIAEHASVVDQILHGTHAVVALATSRIALRIRAETVFDLPAMGVPGEEATDAQGIGHFEAVRLFIDRASSATQSFQVNAGNAPAIAAICRRVDGIPLAIELAAARIRSLSVDEIHKRISTRLALLTGGPRDLPKRQQTLRNTIDWSYELLDPTDARVFCALGAFAGLIRLSAAESILESTVLRPGEAMDALQLLVDSSLLLLLPIADDEPTFGMLETIYEYAAEKLSSTDFDTTVRDAHARYFRDKLTEWQPVEGESPPVEYARMVGSELDNIRAALRWLQDREEASGFPAACIGFASVLVSRATYAEAVDVLASCPDESATDHERCTIHCLKADAFLEQRHVDAAVDALSAAERTLEMPSPADLARVRLVAGRIAALRRDPDARVLLEQALQASLSEQFSTFAGIAEIELGRIAVQAADIDAAMSLNASARSRFERASEHRRVAQCDANIGLLHYLSGDLESARTLLDRAAVGLSRFGDARFLIQIYSNLATLHLARSEYDLARDRALHLQELCRATANQRFEAMGLGIYAEVAIHEGAISESIAAIKRGKRLTTEDRLKVEDAYLSRVLGDALAAIGRLNEAAEEYSRAAVVFAGVGEREELRKAEDGLEKIRGCEQQPEAL